MLPVLYNIHYNFCHVHYQCWYQSHKMKLSSTAPTIFITQPWWNYYWLIIHNLLCFRSLHSYVHWGPSGLGPCLLCGWCLGKILWKCMLISKLRKYYIYICLNCRSWSHSWTCLWGIRWAASLISIAWGLSGCSLRPIHLCGNVVHGQVLSQATGGWPAWGVYIWHMWNDLTVWNSWGDHDVASLTWGQGPIPTAQSGSPSPDSWCREAVLCPQ